MTLFVRNTQDDTSATLTSGAEQAIALDAGVAALIYVRCETALAAVDIAGVVWQASGSGTPTVQPTEEIQSGGTTSKIAAKVTFPALAAGSYEASVLAFVGSGASAGLHYVRLAITVGAPLAPAAVIPSVSAIQSVLYFNQWQEWAFQPFATNTPTGWTSSPLPDGVTIDAGTGLLSGAVEKPGVYVFALTATNAAGNSVEIPFTAGIAPSTWAAPADALDVTLDLTSGLVTINGVTSLPGTPLAQQPVLAWLKSGDAKLFHIRPVKAGVIMDIAFASLALAAKNVEPESAIITSTAFGRAGTGADTYYRMAVQLDGAALAAELANAEDDGGTLLRALFEFAWTWTNTLSPNCGLTTVVGSSLGFALGVERQEIA